MASLANKLEDIKKVLESGDVGLEGNFLVRPGHYVYNLVMNNLLTSTREFGAQGKKTKRHVVRDKTVYTESLDKESGCIA